MPISSDRPELFLAILSMDSYNRGYAAGIEIGGITDTDGLGETGTIGVATIDKKSANLNSGTDPRVDAPAGLYAISYDLGCGETVIAYRGTDRHILGLNPILPGSKSRVRDVGCDPIVNS